MIICFKLYDIWHYQRAKVLSKSEWIYFPDLQWIIFGSIARTRANAVNKTEITHVDYGFCLRKKTQIFTGWMPEAKTSVMVLFATAPSVRQFRPLLVILRLNSTSCGAAQSDRCMTSQHREIASESFLRNVDVIRRSLCAAWSQAQFLHFLIFRDV